MHENSSPKIRLSLIPLLSIVGIGASIYLTQLYHGLHDGSAGFKSLCNLGEGLSCSSVALSKWAELAPGFPLSSFVAGWFLSILILGLLARLDSWKNTAISIGILMTAFGSLYSIFLIYIMAGVLKNICTFCVVVDVVNFLLLGIFWSLKKGPLLSNIDRSKIGASLAMIGVCVFVVVLVTKPVESKALSAEETQYLVNQVLEAKSEEILVDSQSIVMGKIDAPITIVEYSDFQCPFCKRGASLLHNLQEKYPNDVRIVFKNFPLDMACNKIIERPMHELACALAKMAVCAKEKGKFVPVYEKIFELQEGLKAQDMMSIATSSGISEAEMKACMDSESAKSLVNRDIEEGIKLKIESTPTLFVNGKRVPGLLPLAAWDQVFKGLKTK